MQKIATFPKPNDVSVKSTYTYDPATARLKTLLTQKLVGTNPTDTYQNLDYQQFDGKGNLITLADNLNAITHGYTYDSLDRLLTANGAGANPYTQSYQYNRIGNITFKSDVGSYSYTYSNKPHAVRTAGNISSQYDLNGNMTQRRVSGGIRLDITYNYDNKPSLIKKNGSNYVQFTYDGNSQRVKKYNYTTGQTTLYFGELYETRAGVGTIHLFAGTNRVASVLSDGRAQFYHTDHLGSASVITDSNGNRKEQMVYFPFGTYRAVGNINGTYDYDPSFPDVFYTFTDQEDDDDLGFYNYGARLYDPLLGRFISPDTMVPDPNNPQSLNRYSYALNNPLRYIDPSGNVEWDVEWYDQGEIGSDYGTWGSFGNLSLNFRPPRASIIYNDSLIYRGIYPSTNQQHMLDWSDIDSVGKPFTDYKYVQNNPIRFKDPFGLARGDWWDPRTYVQFALSWSALLKGTTTSGGIEQETMTFLQLIGGSVDIYIGKLPSPCERSYELGLGLGKHLGIGYFYSRPDVFGDYQDFGLVFHIGIGVGTPIYFTGTEPANLRFRTPMDTYLEKERK